MIQCIISIPIEYKEIFFVYNANKYQNLMVNDSINCALNPE